MGRAGAEQGRCATTQHGPEERGHSELSGSVSAGVSQTRFCPSVSAIQAENPAIKRYVPFFPRFSPPPTGDEIRLRRTVLGLQPQFLSNLLSKAFGDIVWVNAFEADLDSFRF